MFDELNFVKLQEKKALAKGFVISISLAELDIITADTEIANIFGGIKFRVRILNKGRDWSTMTPYERSEQYFVGFGEDENVAVLEAMLDFKSPFKGEADHMQLGIPLNSLKSGKSDIYLVYDGIRLYFVVDGELVNENFPYGELCCDNADGHTANENIIDSIRIAFNVEDIKTEEYEITTDASINYYSPNGANIWAGDVATLDWYGFA